MSYEFPTIDEGADIADLYVKGALQLPAMSFDPDCAADPLSRLALEELNAEAAAHNALAGASNSGVMAVRSLVNEALEDVPAAEILKNR